MAIFTENCSMVGELFWTGPLVLPCFFFKLIRFLCSSSPVLIPPSHTYTSNHRFICKRISINNFIYIALFALNKMDCHNNRSLLYASQPVSFISFHFLANLWAIIITLCSCLSVTLSVSPFNFKAPVTLTGVDYEVPRTFSSCKIVLTTY